MNNNQKTIITKIKTSLLLNKEFSMNNTISFLKVNDLKYQYLIKKSWYNTFFININI